MRAGAAAGVTWARQQRDLLVKGWGPGNPGCPGPVSDALWLAWHGEGLGGSGACVGRRGECQGRCGLEQGTGPSEPVVEERTAWAALTGVGAFRASAWPVR